MRKGKALKMTPALKRALDLSREFFDLEPRKVKRVDIDWPKALVCLGVCPQVDYISDKFDGKIRHYFHEFEGPCQLFAGDAPQVDGSNILIIHGNFKLKPEGITG